MHQGSVRGAVSAQGQLPRLGRQAAHVRAQAASEPAVDGRVCSCCACGLSTHMCTLPAADGHASSCRAFGLSTHLCSLPAADRCASSWRAPARARAKVDRSQRSDTPKGNVSAVTRQKALSAQWHAKRQCQHSGMPKGNVSAVERQKAMSTVASTVTRQGNAAGQGS